MTPGALRDTRPGTPHVHGPEAQFCFRWVAGYLFCLDVVLDGRLPSQASQRLMLVPVGAPEIDVFQQRYPLKDMTYTHSVAAFYPVPPVLDL